MDPIRVRVREALFPKKPNRARVPKPIVNTKWYRKDPRPVNSKLSQAIVDAMPFHIDKRRANLIVKAIFDAITEGLYRGERVTIEGFGSWTRNKRRGKYIKNCINRTEPVWKPERYLGKFHSAPVLRRFVNSGDVKEDGNNSASK